MRRFYARPSHRTATLDAGGVEMVVRCWSAVVLACVVVLPVVGMAQQQEQQEQQQVEDTATCRSAIPANVDAGMLRSEVIALLGRSDTFRAQCERIAAQPRVRVRLHVVNTIDSGGRAQAALHGYRSGALYADVELLFGANYRELLAHEFEHVIEQIDGVDLRDEA